MGRKSVGVALASALLATASGMALSIGTARAQTAAESARAYRIEAQPLASALSEYARQADVQVLYAYEPLRGLRAPAVVGQYSREDALRRLLEGSGLTASFERGVVRLEQTGRPQYEPADFQQSGEPLETSRDSAGNAGAAPVASTDEEIVVTGTRLRGESPSPVTTISREEIEESGAATVTQLLRTLPQNFGGGPNETTRTGEGANNLLEGSSINLRGLGADSTLVLVNGRRISTTGTSNGLFVDVSTIPVTAIERVEVLTDGASAIYGSDAIGGVVNFILREDFNGAESSARYGAAYDGGAVESGLSLSFGRASDRARFFGAFDYFHRDPLANADRDFAANSDLTPYGGSNFSLTASNPGTVVSPVIAGVPFGQDGTDLTAGDFNVGQRNFQNTMQGQEIIGEQQRRSIYLSGGFDVLPTFELFAEARASVRDFERNRAGATTNSLRVPSTHPDFVALTPGSTSMTLQYSFVDDLGNVIASGDSESLSFVGGVRSNLGTTWRLELSGQWGSEEGLYRTDNIVNAPRLNEALGLTNAIATFDPSVDGYFNPFADGSNTPQNVLDFIRGWSESRYSSEMQSVTLQADGELFTLPAGAVRLAIGTEYREETFGSRTVEFQSSLTPVLRQSPSEERDVTAYFAEARVPIIGDGQNIFGIRSLDLSLAARHEDTSNGGAETTPKIGILWSPFEGLMLRSSWGRSFKAPSLIETVAGLQDAFVIDLPDPLSGSGFTTTLVLLGTNPDLEAERAETWTAGFTLRPQWLEGFSFDLNVFRIDFQDRISSPANPFTVLADAALYGPITTRDPDDALVQSIFDAPFYQDFGDTPPAADVGAIVDGRLRNLSRSIVSGMDFEIGQQFEISGFDVRASLSGSYLFEYEQSFSETSPGVDIVGTAGNPVDLRLRAALNIGRDNWNGGVFVNYTDDYIDTLSSPDRHVESWTTVDLSLGYAFSASGVAARLFVRNAFNEDPPFLNNPIGVGYDPENADPLGRFISLQITKTW